MHANSATTIQNSDMRTDGPFGSEDWQPLHASMADGSISEASIQTTLRPRFARCGFWRQVDTWYTVPSFHFSYAERLRKDPSPTGHHCAISHRTERFKEAPLDRQGNHALRATSDFYLHSALACAHHCRLVDTVRVSRAAAQARELVLEKTSQCHPTRPRGSPLTSLTSTRGTAWEGRASAAPFSCASRTDLKPSRQRAQCRSRGPILRE